jgi:LDH2 family malate/lactate/ureidoglycolate dehydrogenase
MAPTVIASAGDLRSFAEAVLRAAKVPAEDSEICADGMIWADLRGIDMGLKRLTTLIQRLRAGGTLADPKPAVVNESAGFAVLDGHASWGQVASVKAMRIAIAKARKVGIGGCVVRDSGNSLAMGYYPGLAIAEGMIGLAITNAIPLQAPWGGSQKLLGNQAYALGCPAGRHPPILFDSATTAITWVGIHEYQGHGEQIPLGVALDANGNPTTDPATALAGLLLPAGGHRGYGLALMWEILTGVLSGGDVFAPLPVGPYSERAWQSTFLLAIDPAKAMPFHMFVARVDEFIDRIHASPPAPGISRVLVPGEHGAEIAAERQRSGIPLSAARAAELRVLAKDYGVPLPAGLR